MHMPGTEAHAGHSRSCNPELSCKMLPQTEDSVFGTVKEDEVWLLRKACFLQFFDRECRSKFSRYSQIPP